MQREQLTPIQLRTGRARSTLIAAVAAFGLTLTGCASSATSGDQQSSATDAGALPPETFDSGSNSGSAPAAVQTEEQSSAATVAGSEQSADATVPASDDLTTAPGTDAEADLVTDTVAEDDSFDGANFEDYGQRVFIETARDPLSTFSLDVDTGSYAITRAAVQNGQLPPPAAVRPEEFINAQHYDYDSPDRGLAVSVDGSPSPFTRESDMYLVRVGVSSEAIADEDRGPVSLTFVIDTSGSMDAPNRLGLVKTSLATLVDELSPSDTVAIVTYSNDSGIVLEPTPIAERDTILDAIDDLESSGSTNLEAGVETGYRLADEAATDDGTNVVILASDGIANVGLTDADPIAKAIQQGTDNDISLVTLGFGMEGYNDQMMEQLADRGDGFYSYVDTEAEADRLFRDELTSTLITVAKDSKVQVKFNPEVVDEYRLIGYENRAVADSDFRNDDVDAGELGAGHEATAMYEVRVSGDADPEAEIGTVFLRWANPDDGEVTEAETEITMGDMSDQWSNASDSFQLAAVATGFAELLRYSQFNTDVDMNKLSERAGALDQPELSSLIASAADLR